MSALESVSPRPEFLGGREEDRAAVRGRAVEARAAARSLGAGSRGDERRRPAGPAVDVGRVLVSAPLRLSVVVKNTVAPSAGAPRRSWRSRSVRGPGRRPGWSGRRADRARRRPSPCPVAGGERLVADEEDAGAVRGAAAEDRHRAAVAAAGQARRVARGGEVRRARRQVTRVDVVGRSPVGVESCSGVVKKASDPFADTPSKAAVKSLVSAAGAQELARPRPVSWFRPRGRARRCRTRCPGRPRRAIRWSRRRPRRRRRSPRRSRRRRRRCRTARSAGVALLRRARSCRLSRFAHVDVPLDVGVGRRPAARGWRRRPSCRRRRSSRRRRS